jgi:hypothetical protein
MLALGNVGNSSSSFRGRSPVFYCCYRCQHYQVSTIPDEMENLDAYCIIIAAIEKKVIKMEDLDA